MDISAERTRLFDEYLKTLSKPIDATDDGFVKFLVTELASQAIVGAMKNEDYIDVRLTHLDAWMYWHDTEKQWVVRNRGGNRGGRRYTDVIYRGTDEAAAVKALMGEH